MANAPNWSMISPHLRGIFVSARMGPHPSKTAWPPARGLRNFVRATVRKGRGTVLGRGLALHRCGSRAEEEDGKGMDGGEQPTQEAPLAIAASICTVGCRACYLADRRHVNLPPMRWSTQPSRWSLPLSSIICLCHIDPHLRRVHQPSMRWSTLSWWCYLREREREERRRHCGKGELTGEAASRRNEKGRGRKRCGKGRGGPYMFVIIRGILHIMDIDANKKIQGFKSKIELWFTRCYLRPKI